MPTALLRYALNYAKVLRLKGWVLSLKGDLESAEQNFLASLDWARRQQAKSWELRTSTSLARLWQNQGQYHRCCIPAPFRGICRHSKC